MFHVSCCMWQSLYEPTHTLSVEDCTAHNTDLLQTNQCTQLDPFPGDQLSARASQGYYAAERLLVLEMH